MHHYHPGNVLVPAAQRSESAIGAHLSSPSGACPQPHPSCPPQSAEPSSLWRAAASHQLFYGVGALASTPVSPFTPGAHTFTLPYKQVRLYQPRGSVRNAPPEAGPEGAWLRRNAWGD